MEFAMLMVLSADGSPGGSTIAVYLAIQMASQGTETLLLEADPSAGSLARKLGIQITPGTASYVASQLPVEASNLIEHAQDVLFSSLHVMPGPSSQAGARSVAGSLAAVADQLRDVADSEMALVLDGGPLNAESATADLVTRAAGVLVVAGASTDVDCAGHLRGMVSDDPTMPGPKGFALTVGAAQLSDDEWLGRFGLEHLASLDLDVNGAVDFGAFMPGGKRKWRRTREQFADLVDSLSDYAYPASAQTPRPRLRLVTAPADEAPEGDDADPQDVGAASAEGTGVGASPAEFGPAPGAGGAAAAAEDGRSVPRAYTDLDTVELAVPAGLAAPKLPADQYHHPSHPNLPPPAPPGVDPRVPGHQPGYGQGQGYPGSDYPQPDHPQQPGLGYQQPAPTDPDLHVPSHYHAPYGDPSARTSSRGHHPGYDEPHSAPYRDAQHDVGYPADYHPAGHESPAYPPYRAPYAPDTHHPSPHDAVPYDQRWHGAPQPAPPAGSAYYEQMPHGAQYPAYERPPDTQQPGYQHPGAYPTPAPPAPYDHYEPAPPADPAYRSPPPGQPAPPPPAPEASRDPEPPAEPPSGSFRSWAGQLYEPHDDVDDAAVRPPPERHAR
ncbi:MAG: hypothetical protein F4064_05065 [Acidimicrobiales bacterium]|nr:hypothetical protein [Acidimicrobiales bacterium]